MRHYFLRAALLLLTIMMMPTKAAADTSVIQDGQDGWTKITAIPDDPSLYFFAFADNSNDLMLEMHKGGNNGNNALYYMSSKDPLQNRSFLWTLEPNSGDFAGMYSMRNAEYTVLMVQTEWNAGFNIRTNDQPNPCDWTALNFQYDSSNGCWTIENGKYPMSSNAGYKGYLGPWSNTIANGAELAGNKQDSSIGQFQIYAIKKTDAENYYTSLAAAATTEAPADLSLYINNRESNLNGLDGWTTSGLVGRNTGNSYDGKPGFFEPSDWNAASFSCNMSQTLSGIPNGKYQLKAAAQASEGCTLILSATSGEVTTSATLSSKGASGSSLGIQGWEWLSTETFNVTGNQLTIKVETSANAAHNWGNVDGFRLLYLGPVSAGNMNPGDDITDIYIKNPSFEDDNGVVNVNGGGTITGWTINPANDTGVYSPTDGSHTTVGYTGNYILNHWWTGTPLTQNIGILPAGVYQLSADVATGNAATSLGTLYLNANEARSTGFVSSDNRIMREECLVFQSDGANATTIGLRGGEDASVDANGAVVKGAWRESGYWWYKADNFRLVYLGNTAEQLAGRLATLVSSCQPYDDVDDITDYTEHYNTYATYSASNSIAELTEAINYLTNEYDDYCWNNASIDHPVDLTASVIKGAECTSNDAWPGSGRTTATGTYYDGTTRTYFTQNHENGAARSQAVTVFYEGAYLLRTIVRPTIDAAYATISLGDKSTTTKGIPASGKNIGNGWTYNDIYYYQTDINQDKNISISLSNINNGREADCGEMHLYYIGRKADFIDDDTHFFVGKFASAPAIELTDEVPVADITAADMTGANVIFTNPNGLVFAKENSQVASTAKNIIVGGTCANLQLEGGHPFINPQTFTANNASYSLTENYLAGGLFATLTLPFNATTLAGQAYVLDTDINPSDGNINGTEVNNITADKPVLVTAAGSYSGTDVSVSTASRNTTCTNGKLVGVYSTTEAPASSYVLQNHTSGEGVRFYIVGPVIPSVGPFRAYIKPQDTGVKSIGVDFGLSSDISETYAGQEMKMEGAQVFSIGGTRLSRPQKGINIVRYSNGTTRKVIIK